MGVALQKMGWDLEARGLPNNQEELAYTLLTFSFVFLRSVRKLGIGFTPQQEDDYIHAWNVMGHVLGIRREVMAETMDEAERLFARMQERGREAWVRRPISPDPRPPLAAALMDAMRTVFPEGMLKSAPVLLTRFLMGPMSAKEVGLQDKVSLPAV